MIYFIGWVVFLLLAIAAVPLAMMLEGKSRQRGAYLAGDEMAGDSDASGAGDDEDLQPLDGGGDDFGGGGDDFAEAEAGDDLGGGDFGGGDDFGAFDEELK